jgi:hypothetical protein
METLRDVLTAQARRFEQRVFLEYKEEQCSFGTLDGRTARSLSGNVGVGRLSPCGSFIASAGRMSLRTGWRPDSEAVSRAARCSDCRGVSPLEATCICCANPYTGVRKPGSLGRPLPGVDCAVVHAQGREVAPGNTGEIVVRGPNIMKEYYRDPEKTARVFRDSWFHTGDFGYIDPEGYYWMADSRSEIQD